MYFNRRTALGVFLLPWVLQAADAWACASCGCGDPTLTAMGQEKPFKGRIRFSAEIRYGGHTSGEEDVQIGRLNLAVSYSPHARFALSLQVPGLIVASTYGDSSSTLYTGGLGDAELALRGILYRDRRFSPHHLLGVLAGIKVPSGPRMNASNGYPAAPDLQPGSGSWDPIVGLSYGYFGDRISLFVSGAYRQSTPGFRGYRRGSVLGFTAQVQVPLASKLAIVWGLDAGYQEADTIDQVRGTLPGSGGGLLSLTPGVLLSPKTDWLLRVSLQLPVLQVWSGPKWEYPLGIVQGVWDF